MTHIRKRDFYMEQRARVGTNCLKIVIEWGEDRAEQIFKGNIHAIIVALIALIGRNATAQFLDEVMGQIPPPRTKPSIVWNRDSAA